MTNCMIKSIFIGTSPSEKKCYKTETLKSLVNLYVNLQNLRHNRQIQMFQDLYMEYGIIQTL